MYYFRSKIWEFCRKHHPEGCILSKKLIFLRFLLYPISTFLWRMGTTRGYQWRTDTWIIEGVEFSSSCFKILDRAKGKCYKITKNDGVIMLEEITCP